MRNSNRMAAGPDARRESPRATLAFSGAGEGLAFQADDGESDWDEIQFLGRIERDGMLRMETADFHWD